MWGHVGFFGRISNTWSLIGTSWDMVKKDKEMLVFPLVSGLCLLLLLGSFGMGMAAEQGEGWTRPHPDAPTAEQITYYGKLFLIYFCTYFVMMFFNAGIIACAAIRMRGGDPSLGDGFKTAFARVPLLLAWALVAATVGLILRIIEDRSKAVGKIVSGLLGMAWSLTTFLVLPVLVVEGKGPLAAIKESTKMLKETWGEQLIAGFGFGLLWLVCCLPGFLIFAAAAMLATSYVIVWLALLIAYMVILALVFSVMQTCFQAALYHYARQSVAPPGWDTAMLAGAVGMGSSSG